MTATTDPWVGALLGDRYRILRPLGRGGAGAVYEAEHLGLGRSVAIKLMRPELAGDVEQLERFRREARAAARLGHPHIVQLFDFVDARDGAPAYLVLELVAGRSLYQVLKSEAPLSPERVVHLGCQILAALGAAHAAGIVHRDIKPGNIVVVDVAGVGEVAKVLDFGIARMQESDAYQRLTRTGVIIGTPRYMSPEQASGTSLDARADLWALGVILYAALTGRFPFDGTSSAVLQAILTSPVPAMDSPAVPRALEAVVRRSLEKRRDDRFATAEEMARALRSAAIADTQMGASARPATRVGSTRHAPAPEVATRAGAWPTAQHVTTAAIEARRPPGESAPMPLAWLAESLGQHRLRWLAAIGALTVLGGALVTVLLVALWASDVIGVTWPVAPTAPLPSAPMPSPLPSAPMPSAPLPSGPLPGGPLPSGPLPNAPAPLPSAPVPSTAATSGEHIEEARVRALQRDPSAVLSAFGGDAETDGTSDAWMYMFVTDHDHFAVVWRAPAEWEVQDMEDSILNALELEPPDSAVIMAAAMRDCPEMGTRGSTEIVVSNGPPRMPPRASLSDGGWTWAGSIGPGRTITGLGRCR